MKTLTALLLAICTFGCGYGSNYNSKTGTTTGAATVSSLSPNATASGNPEFVLTVAGSGFGSNSVIYWNGVAHTTGSNATVYTSTTRLTTTISNSEIEHPGAIPVYVKNGTVNSNTMTFTVN